MLELKQTEEFRKWRVQLNDARGSAIIVLLCGGDKSTQQRDIQTAKRLAQAWKE